jgi:hypothetical protein
MAVDLDHPFTTEKPIGESFAAITDLERVVPAVEDGQGHANADVTFQRQRRGHRRVG